MRTITGFEPCRLRSLFDMSFRRGKIAEIDFNFPLSDHDFVRDRFDYFPLLRLIQIRPSILQVRCIIHDLVT